MGNLFEKNSRKDLLKPVIFSKFFNNCIEKLALSNPLSLIFGIGNFELILSEL